MGSDPKSLFSCETFHRQLQKFGVYAIYVGALLIPIINIETYSIPSVDEINACGNCKDFIKEKMFQIPNDSKRAYNKIVVDLFDDLARFDYI